MSDHTRTPGGHAGESEPPTLRIRGPADLVQAIPYLLGFHPRDSLVLVGFAEGRLVVTARADLADLAEPELLPHLVAALRRGGAVELFAAVYDGEPPGRPLPWSGIAPALCADAERAGCTVTDAVRVAGGRYWSYLQPGPDAGTPLPEAPSAFVAEATVAGLVALPDRASLAGTLDPEPGRTALLGRLGRAEQAVAADVLAGRGDAGSGFRGVRRELRAAARRAGPAGSSDPVEVQTLVRFATALRVSQVRDAIWLSVDDGVLDGRALWRELGRRLPSPYDAAPLFLFGWASWRNGNGALAVMAAERAVDSDPTYYAADLLLAALSQGLDPHRVPKLRAARRRSGRAA